MSAEETPARIKLPPLPDRTPDTSIGPTLRHYRHEPTWEINDSTHDEYDTRSFCNPRYILSITSSPWTGAEDSLLLEHIPNNAPCGIGNTLADGQTLSWTEISFQMNFDSFERNISMRDYTQHSCRERYVAIVERIEKGHHQSDNEFVKDGHTGPNPYATLIELGVPCQLAAYWGLENELAGLKLDRNRRIILSGRGRERLPGIRELILTKRQPRKRRASRHRESPRKRIKHWLEQANESTYGLGAWCTAVRC